MIFGTLTGKVEFRDLTIAFVGLVNALTGFYFAHKGESDIPYAGK